MLIAIVQKNQVFVGFIIYKKQYVYISDIVQTKSGNMVSRLLITIWTHTLRIYVNR